MARTSRNANVKRRGPDQPANGGEHSPENDDDTPTSDNVDANNCGRSKRSSARSRTARKDVLDLQRMTTAEFMETIGEGPSASVISQSKALAAAKRKEESVKLKTLAALNDEILGADGVNVSVQNEEGSDLVDETPSGEGRTNTTDTTSLDEVLKKATDATSSGGDPIKATGTTLLDEGPNKSGDTASSGEEPNQSTDKPSSGEGPNQSTDKPLPGKGPNNSGRTPSLGDTPSDNINGGLDVDTVLPSDKASKMHASSQTPNVHILCTCLPCRGVLANFSNMLKTGSSHKCEGKVELNKQHKVTSSVVTDQEEYVPLYKGSKVMVTVTTKAKLRGINAEHPKDYVIPIMESLFTDSEMSFMTAEGRTEGSVKMNPDIKNALFIYIANKFDNFQETDLTDIINKKCYAARRKLWSKGDNTDEVVRKPLQKKRRSNPETPEQSGRSKNVKEPEESRKKRKQKVLYVKDKESGRHNKDSSRISLQKLSPLKRLSSPRHSLKSRVMSNAKRNKSKDPQRKRYAGFSTSDLDMSPVPLLSEGKHSTLEEESSRATYSNKRHRNHSSSSLSEADEHNVKELMGPKRKLVFEGRGNKATDFREEVGQARDRNKNSIPNLVSRRTTDNNRHGFKSCSPGEDLERSTVWKQSIQDKVQRKTLDNNRPSYKFCRSGEDLLRTTERKQFSSDTGSQSHSHGFKRYHTPHIEQPSNQATKRDHHQEKRHKSHALKTVVHPEFGQKQPKKFGLSSSTPQKESSATCSDESSESEYDNRYGSEEVELVQTGSESGSERN